VTEQDGRDGRGQGTEGDSIDKPKLQHGLWKNMLLGESESSR